MFYRNILYPELKLKFHSIKAEQSHRGMVSQYVEALGKLTPILDTLRRHVSSALKSSILLHQETQGWDTAF